MQKRLNVFLHGFVTKTCPELLAFCQKLLLLLHGQASVERGFSANMEVKTVNLQEYTLVAQSLVCDYVNIKGGRNNRFLDASQYGHG